MSTKLIPLASAFPLNSRLTSLTCQLDTSIWCPLASQINMPKTELLICHSFHPVNCISVNDTVIMSFCSSQKLRGHPLFLYSSPSIESISKLSKFILQNVPSAPLLSIFPNSSHVLSLSCNTFLTNFTLHLLQSVLRMAIGDLCKR